MLSPPLKSSGVVERTACYLELSIDDMLAFDMLAFRNKLSPISLLSISIGHGYIYIYPHLTLHAKL